MILKAPVSATPLRLLKKLLTLSITDVRFGHESLSILFRYAHNLLSVLDPVSSVAIAT